MTKAGAAVGVGTNVPAPNSHSRFGASGADRWIECPGSVQAQTGLSDTTTFYAAEGTAGHEVAALCLQDGHDAEAFLDRRIKVKDFPETIEFTEELAEAVQVFVDTVRADKEARGGKLLIERAFHLAWLDEEFWGTSDAARLGTDDVLSVYDLKLGKGKGVEVTGNRQLAYYALGVIGTLPESLQAKIKKIELVVVQPRRAHRDGPVRRWETTPTDLLDFTQDLVDAAKNARSKQPDFKAGDHCKFCRAAGTCKTLANLAAHTAQMDFDDDPAPIPPEDLGEKEMADILDKADIIEAWIKAVRARADALANAGADIPGWKLVDKRATRRWSAEDQNTTAQTLLFDFGLDESSIFSQKLKTPAQIEKMLPKGDRKALAGLYDKESSGKKLARVTDPRDEVASTAQTDFAD